MSRVTGILPALVAGAVGIAVGVTTFEPALREQQRNKLLEQQKLFEEQHQSKDAPQKATEMAGATETCTPALTDATRGTEKSPDAPSETTATGKSIWNALGGWAWSETGRKEMAKTTPTVSETVSKSEQSKQ